MKRRTFILVSIVQLFVKIELIDVNLKVNSVFIIKNEEYPNYYHHKVDLEWSIASPQNTSLYLTCRLDLPEFDRCNTDYIEIYSDNRAHKYCGKTKLSTDTETNRIKIVLYAEENTYGGLYRCRIKAIRSNPEITPNCECGWRNEQLARIVDGTYTKPNEFPCMAHLWHTPTRQWPGSATIIAEKYALTAAHVVYKRNDLSLIVGDYNLSYAGQSKYYAQYEIERNIIHPLFDPYTARNDIAIIQTRQPIKFSRYVAPVCLPFRYKFHTFASEKVLALGWGFTSPKGTDSDALRQVGLTVLGHTNCANYYDPPVRITEMCTLGDGHKDACDGDSGGPILWPERNSERLYLIGIIEAGDSCGTGVPSVNTRVTSFLSWILNNVNDVKFCVK